jgi:hypothetical protein
LGRKVKTAGENTKSEILWAGIDGFVLGSSLKLLKADKMASSGKLVISENFLSITKKLAGFLAS